MKRIFFIVMLHTLALLSVAQGQTGAQEQRQGILLENLTWVEAEKVLNADTIVVVPIGAAAKEHGPHLKLKNDWILAEYLKKRVLEKSQVVIAPVVNYHFYPAFVEYPGSTTLRLETARDLIVDICRSLARYGPRRFYALNTGVSTLRALRPASELLAAEGITLRYTDLLKVIGPVEKAIGKQEGGTHADEIETSMILYMDPASVEMSKAAKDYHPQGRGGLTRNPKGEGTYSPTGIWGDPTLATREKGRVVTEALVEGILKEIEELRRVQVSSANPSLNYDAMAARIVGALKLRAGERVLIRFDPGYFNGLVGPLRRRIRASGAVDVGALEYIESAAIRAVPSDDAKRRASLEAQSQAFEQLLEAADVYLWLPLREAVREVSPAERLALARWLDKGGARRQIHFHWSSGSVLVDGLPGEHSAELDRIYQNALDIDYANLSEAQDQIIALLRSGTVRVRTKAGTDLSFRVGDRPFNKQNGDASAERMQTARMRVDREIELPAGVLRVAPLEETVQGRLVIPMARFGDKVARNLRLEIKDGRVTRIEADENLSAVEAALNAGGEAARRFREFGIGFNPKLFEPPNSSTIPYYGYGAGVVRLSLGDNEELGGAVRGNFVRWFFSTETNIEIDGNGLVLTVMNGRIAVLLNKR